MNSFTYFSTAFFSTPVGNPEISAYWGDEKFCWEGNFYVVVGYLSIGEMGNFAGRGIFMWWLESEEELF